MGAELGEKAVRQPARPRQNLLLKACLHLHLHLLPEPRVVRRERANYTLVPLLKRIRVLWCQIGGQVVYNPVGDRQTSLEESIFL